MCSRKCAMPVAPRSSLREPTRYQTWTVTIGLRWSSRRSTRRPLSSVVATTTSAASAVAGSERVSARRVAAMRLTPFSVSSGVMRRPALLLLILLVPGVAAAQPCTESFTTLYERVSPAVVSIQATKINKSKPQRRFETVVDSAQLRVGDEVAAIGNPIGLEQTMTRGIVSGLNRFLPGLAEQPLIQTDAPINPGNSGGPLVDRCGNVIGINTFISEEAQSIGFSIPINSAKAILRELRDTGRVVRAWLGVEGRELDGRLSDVVKLPLVPGYLVELVHEGSPAERAGVRGGTMSVVVQGEEYLLGGDILTAIQGTSIRTKQEYVAKVRALKPGQRVRVTIVRDGQTRELTLTVAERPRLPSDLID